MISMQGTHLGEQAVAWLWGIIGTITALDVIYT